jgi:hypothetical protein
VTRGSLAAALACALLLAGGCGDEGTMIDWDLSDSHTTADVHWPKPDLNAVEVKAADSLRIRLPEGRVLSENGVVDHVNMGRDGKLVTSIHVDSKPRSTDDAYELAKRWAKDWGLPAQPIESWHEQRVAGRKRGDEDVLTTTSTGAKPGSTIGKDGPQPSLQIRHSFEDDRPSLVSLQFNWGHGELGG